MIIAARYLMTGDGKSVLENKAVLTGADGKIKRIGAKEILMKEFPEEEYKDYGDATLLPGLFDMHVHLAYWYSQPDSFNYGSQLVMLYALQHAQSAFERGITSVRDMSSAHGVCKNLKLAAEKGFVTIPHITHTDTGMCMSGGHGWEEVAQVDGPWEVRREIRRQVRDGAEWVKILTTHRSHIPEYTQEELDAAVDECHRRGIKCGVHAGTNPGIQMCIDAGFDTIEHATFMTLDHAKQMAEKGIAWTPTIMAYTLLYDICKENLEKNAGAPVNDPVMQKEMKDYQYFEPAYKAYKEHFKEFYDTGITVIAGTDMVMYQSPLLPLPRELQYMVEYGITPVQAIQTATYNPAKVLGVEDERGLVKEGLDADLLVVGGDLSKDITCLNDVKLVTLGGRKVFENGIRYVGTGNMFM
ncbi:Xaa-Pro dipeptidase [Lachnospiraceae bacterium]|uniref:amidohydrolase family protein n=1 Tax=Extibacter sp. GGCC_0201 TaxID=2731209 RepID=UPI001AA173D0|nr:amidohydrolase family protein [Extibacter sp. GGCC_0201]MBO1719692.1 amidohydrolase family protein [Extibacter sp. GGCC_0201]BDF33812.1 Xaa-Pro dipeptidase [Lachnospiraceae bacterium]BDF37817.1 Xaa-Pro dipeptidase [Lachnospiraceae bacterium]